MVPLPSQRPAGEEMGELQEALWRLPKAELHQHLDGALRPETAVELAAAIGLNLGLDEARLRMIAPARDVHIIGVGSCTPDRVVTNQDLEKIVDTSDEWITSRTGIKERRIADPDMPSSALATEAVRRALKDAQVEGSEVDQIFGFALFVSFPVPAVPYSPFSPSTVIPKAMPMQQSKRLGVSSVSQVK